MMHRRADHDSELTMFIQRLFPDPGGDLDGEEEALRTELFSHIKAGRRVIWLGHEWKLGPDELAKLKKCDEEGERLGYLPRT